MNARDIIKLAAQLYVYDALKKKITILTNIQKGKDINVDIFLPKVTDVTVSDFAKHLQKAIASTKGYRIATRRRKSQAQKIFWRAYKFLQVRS